MGKVDDWGKAAGAEVHMRLEEAAASLASEWGVSGGEHVRNILSKYD